MREILFRGKRIDNGEWVEGSLLKVTLGGKTAYLIFGNNFLFSGNDVKAMSHALVDPATVGQYTGMVDMDGAKIFEGDVVEGADFDYDAGYGVVQWYDGAYEVCNRDWCGSFLENYFGSDFEVIGNIYDNPELVKEESR